MKQPIEDSPYSIAMNSHGRWEIPNLDMHILQISMVKAPTKQTVAPLAQRDTTFCCHPRCYFVSWCLG